MVALSEADVLAIWESAAERPPLSRALVLAAAAGADPARIADERVGRRDIYLVQLREHCFGTAYGCVVDCPDCRAELEFELASADVRSQWAGDGAGECCADGHDIAFRAVTTRDLLTVGGSADPRRAVIERCVTGVSGTMKDPDTLTDSALDAISAAMAGCDPQAALSVDVDCAVCGHQWSAPFDIAGYLWAELCAASSVIMHDVHGLATAYGWSEADVLAVSPARRRRYLELVT